MKNVYDKCPQFENKRWSLRLIKEEDVNDLLAVYSDKNALPFFNSDNCDGDNFYYPTIERMSSAVKFWLDSYYEKWFVRWVIIDKAIDKVVGTIELFRRISDDRFDGVGILRLDLKSELEYRDCIKDILSVIIPPAYELFGCDEIATKGPIYAVERIAALEELGFEKTDELLIDKEGNPNSGYWIVKK